MYEIGTIGQFEAAHQLVGDFGPATRLHGHTYRLEVVVRGETLQPDGALYDLGQLGGTVDGLIAELNYQNLDTVPGLAGVNTTAEAVASFCWTRIASSLSGRGLHSLHVRVWESPKAFAGRDDLLEA